MDHDSARIDAGANVPFALLAVGLPSLVLREAMSVGALERCHTRADVESSKPRVRIDCLPFFASRGGQGALLLLSVLKGGLASCNILAMSLLAS